MPESRERKCAWAAGPVAMHPATRVTEQQELGEREMVDSWNAGAGIKSKPSRVDGRTPRRRGQIKKVKCLVSTK
ncbi:predicted protein [Uncinocarpus reesii 1704]|uniref:Uncharacterized protein n=1 Tax=Uncinocarpus reesii (strain UAMH 1704) TaxID=336963 RepID=C4JDH3_UNCRE|nr:uncharacterized protein UREG_00699 [Uncinocarpus reesii 1704]EEP75852.1 predicted protein [Uncinocarpus reesii 1704]